MLWCNDVERLGVDRYAWLQPEVKVLAATRSRVLCDIFCGVAVVGCA